MGLLKCVILSYLSVLFSTITLLKHIYIGIHTVLMSWSVISTVISAYCVPWIFYQVLVPIALYSIQSQHEDTNL